MFCFKCGSELPDDAAFCVKCGQKMESAETGEEPVKMQAQNVQPQMQAETQATGPQPQPQAAGQIPPENGPSAQAPPPAAGVTANAGAKKPPVIAIAVAAVALLAVVVGVLLFRKPTINLAKYVTITCEGYNGYGTATAEYDRAAFRKAIDGKIKLTADAKERFKDMGMDGTDEDVVDVFAELLESGSFDRSTELSNGDEIVYHWDFDDSYKKYFRVNIKGNDIKTKVKDLEEVEAVDVFEGLEISYEGYAPNGKAVITATPDSDFAGSLSYRIEPAEGLNNGDTIRVTAEGYGGDVNSYLARNHGVIAAETGKEYTVEGLEEAKGIDPFEYVEVTFKGISPNMTAEYEAKEVDREVGKLNYEFDRSRDLAIGDTVTLKVTTREDNLSRYGIALNETEKTYSIESGDQYITDVAEIKEEFLEKMQAEAEDILTAWQAKIGDDYYKVSMSDPEYVGMVMLTNKTKASDNCLYLVYKADFTDNRASTHALYFGELQDAYLPVRFDGIVQYQDGAQAYETLQREIRGTMSNKYRIGSNYHLSGAENAEDMFTEMVRKSADNYNSSMTEELQKLYQK